MNIPFTPTEHFSREAEQSVLGGLMLNNAAWDAVSELITKDDFHLPQHQIIWRAFNALTNKSEPLDIVTLAEFLQTHNYLEKVGGGEYLALLASNIPTAANIIAYTQIVRERSILRQLLKLGINIAESVNSPDGRTSEQLLEIAEQKLYQIATTGKTFAFVNTNELLSRLVDRMDYLANNAGALTGLDTGFTTLNDLTHGMQKSDLIIVAGTPGTGKTSFAINIATHAIQHQQTVVIFSLEMPDVQLGNKIVSSLSGVDLQRVSHGPTDDDWPKITNAIGILTSVGSLLHIDDSPSLTTGELRSRARKLATQQPVDLIIVDYLQLMNCPNTDNRVEEISAISRGLKAIAKELNVPVIALSQLNREVSKRTNKRPVMQDLRGSGEIEQNADIIILLHRERDEQNEPINNDAEVIIAKHRNGPPGTFALRFNAQTTTFMNIDSYDYS